MGGDAVTTAGRQQRWRRGWRPWVALAAGYLLVIQALLAGLAVAGHAVAAEAGSLAAVICTADGVRTGADPGGDPAEPHRMSCCLIGCSNAGPGVAPPSALGSVVPGPGRAAGRRPAMPVGQVVAEHRRSPRSTRAPPPAV